MDLMRLLQQVVEFGEALRQEAPTLGPLSEVERRYRALHCHIKPLHKASATFHKLKQLCLAKHQLWYTAFLVREVVGRDAGVSRKGRDEKA